MKTNYSLLSDFTKGINYKVQTIFNFSLFGKTFCFEVLTPNPMKPKKYDASNDFFYDRLSAPAKKGDKYIYVGDQIYKLRKNGKHELLIDGDNEKAEFVRASLVHKKSVDEIKEKLQ